MLKTIEIINDDNTITEKIQLNIQVNDTMSKGTLQSKDFEGGNIASLTCYYSLQELNITNLYVNHEYRHQSYGSNLLEHAIQIAKSYKCKSIILDDCSDRFKLSHNIYIKFGFRYIDTNFPEMILNL